jgi:predicted aldo/keto reductase-like oxidoreductase
MKNTNEIRSGQQPRTQGVMEQRTLGETAEQVSAIGLGGFHLALPTVTETDAIRIVRTAVDRGITFLDNCWDYNEGESERRMGKALGGGYRDKVFLMTKFDGRTKQSALKQLDESLQRLQTDRVDLWQFHETIRLEDPDRFFAEGGAGEAVLEAKAAGKIRHAGFTGHKDPLVHLRMLEVADEHGFRWDTAQMPINVMDAHFRSFEKRVLPELNRRNMGALAMKSMGDGKILESRSVKPLECLRYALSRPVSVVITGIDRLELIDQAFEAVRTYQELDGSQIEDILSRTAPLAARGEFEPFKIDVTFDSTAKHQDWMGYPA